MDELGHGDWSVPAFSSVGDDVNAETIGPDVPICSASTRHFFELEGARMDCFWRDVYECVLLVSGSDEGGSGGICGV